MFHGVRAQTADTPQAALIFFYSGGKAHFLKPSTRWAGVQMATGASGTQLANSVSTRAEIDRSRVALHYGRQHVLLLPLQAQRVGVRQALSAALQKRSGVRRAVRVFDSGRANSPIIETDEFLIQFKSGVSHQQATALLRPYGAVLGAALGHYAPNGYVAHVLDPTRTATDVANALYGKAEVVFSHPNYIWPMQPRFVPNDPLFPQQWQLHNTGQSGGIAGADIKAEQAWDTTRGNASVIVAFIDTGIDIDHEEFQGKVVASFDEITKTANPRPQDGGNGDENHGTEAAGLAVATGNNGVGISGVAPNCKLMAVRAIVNGETDQDLADAFVFAADHGASVINNSWGPVDGTRQAQPLPDVIRKGIDYAVTHGRGGKGCVITWAAGNGTESADLDGFSSYENVISVAASTIQDQHAYYSDFGNSVDVCAPSSGAIGNVTTTDRTGGVGDDPGNYMSFFSGTSASAPLAAGTAALILSVNPSLTYTQVRDILENTADKIDPAGGAYDSNGHSQLYGYGRINAYRAVLAAKGTPPTITLLSPPANSTVSGNYLLRAKTTNDAIVRHVDFARRSQDDVADATRTPALAIPDLTKVTDSLALTAPGIIEHGAVTANITHTAPSDLVVTLIAPDGTRTVLYNHEGNSDSITDTGLSITAAVPLTGKKIAGTWRLEVADTVAGDSGTLDNWNLSFTADWIPIASVTKAINGEWTATWSTGTTATTRPGVYEVEAIAVTSAANAITENRNVTVTAVRSYTVSGRATASTGAALANVVLTLTNAAAPSSTPVIAKTDAQGNYTLAGVVPGTYTIKPTLTGTTFSPTTRIVTVSTANITGINFVAAPDRIAPTVTVTRPAVAPNNRYTGVTAATGTATDAGSGVAQVTGLLYRYPTGTIPAGYWNGTTWTTTYNATTNERVATGTTTWTLALPTLTAGNYYFRATAKDKAGNLGRSAVLPFTITAVTVKTITPTPTSTVALSIASASAATDSIQLQFTGALDADAASSPASYSATINGHAVTVQSAGYNATTRTVTLALPEQSLRGGDKVIVQWSGLVDAKGLKLNGQVGPLIVR